MQIVAKKLLSVEMYFSTFSQRLEKVKKPKVASNSSMNEDVFQAYRNKAQNNSILRQFRQQVFRRSQLNAEWQGIKRKQQQYQQKLQQLLDEQDSQKVLKNVTKMESRLANKRNLFHQNDQRSLLSNYGDYTTYNKVYPVFQDRNLTSGEYLEQQTINKKLYEFIDRLPDEYEEKIHIKNQIQKQPLQKHNMTIKEYGEEIQNKINESRNNHFAAVEKEKIHLMNKRRLLPFLNTQSYHPYTGTKKLPDPWNYQQNLEATLSPRAINTIYQLYLQGWTIRDISKRFGILPARAKFCVWVRAQLFHQVIPKMGFRYYLKALRYEQKFNQSQKFCDYGLDLQQLNNQNIIQEIHQWNSKMLDAQRKQDQYLGAMLKLEKEKKFNKYELLTVGTLGKQNAMYLLKEWNIFRGKGSDHYFLKNKVFRRLSKAQKKFNKIYY